MKIALAGSGVIVSASPNPAIEGQSVTLSAGVSGANPTGTVTVFDGSTPIPGCSNIALVSGIATCSTTTLALGEHSISAIYAGDANNVAASSAPLILTIAGAFVTPATEPGTGTKSVDA